MAGSNSVQEGFHYSIKEPRKSEYTTSSVEQDMIRIRN